MYSTVKEVAEALWIPFCLSMMGFVVRIAKYGISSWRIFISSLFCSAFVGILAHWFLAGTGIDTQIASAIIAMSGYCGGALLDAFHYRLLRQITHGQLYGIEPVTLQNNDMPIDDMFMESASIDGKMSIKKRTPMGDEVLINNMPIEDIPANEVPIEEDLLHKKKAFLKKDTLHKKKSLHKECSFFQKKASHK